MLHPFHRFPMLIVSGQARSGTTILTKALGSHPAVVSNMKESNYVNSLAGFFRTNLTKPGVVRQLPGSESEFRSHFRDAALNVLFPQDLFQSNEATKLISTFSSLGIENVEWLEHLFPEIRVANIIRCGHEVVSSRRIHQNIGKLTFEEHCVAWAHTIDVLNWGRDRENFFVVRHEHLKEPDSCRATFAELQRKFGLDHSEAPADYVLNNLINTRPTASESASESASETGTEYEDRQATKAEELAERTRRWESWSADERRIFEDVCGCAMEQCGYPIPW